MGIKKPKMEVVLSEDGGRFVLVHPSVCYTIRENETRIAFAGSATDEYVPVEIKRTISPEKRIVGAGDTGVKYMPAYSESLLRVELIEVREVGALQRYEEKIVRGTLFEFEPLRRGGLSDMEWDFKREEIRRLAYIFAEASAQNYSKLAECKFRNLTKFAGRTRSELLSSAGIDEFIWRALGKCEMLELAVQSNGGRYRVVPEKLLGAKG